MDTLYLIIPDKVSNNFHCIIKNTTKDINTYIIKDIHNIPDLKYKKILFCIELNECGFNSTSFEILLYLYKLGKNSLTGSTAGIIIKSPNEFYTKSMSQNIIFLANQLGCRFPGHCVVEATGNLHNLLTWKKKLNMGLEDIYIYLCKKLVTDLLNDNPKLINNPKILALHSSSHKTSNTLMLWNMTRQNLLNCTVDEFHVENGTVTDCKGCSYIACKHYSEHNSCFYGGIITMELLPAVEKSDCIVWICPNYNDSISANLMAVINRLTALYRKAKFYDKTFFSIIVSGNSGSDSVAKQLIGSLNINKGFRLPPYFSLVATANNPGTIKNIKGIEEKAKQFAQIILKEVKK